MDDGREPLACEEALAFGPVPSRRLGYSLGVNVVPKKVCSHNCIYCQLGRTTRLTTERDVYIDTQDILAAVEDKLRDASRTDYVTVIGNGEPTLASNLPEILDGFQARWKAKNALITNGSLLWMEDVRADAARFDAVMPTVSAGDERTYRELHRPHRSIGFDKVVDGLRRFCEDHGDITWAEVMLVRGVNDSPESLKSIGDLLRRLEPAEVHITMPIRPPSVAGVTGPTRETIDMALREIPGAVDFTHPEESSMPSSRSDPVRHLIEISGTHPLRHDQAVAVLVGSGLDETEAEDTLGSLTRSSSLIVLTRDGARFYVRGAPTI